MRPLVFTYISLLSNPLSHLNTYNLSARRELWLLITLAGIQFTYIVDFMVMMPLGPQLTQLFKITDAQFGLLVSAYTLAAGVSGVASAFYIDRFGRKKLLLVMYVLFALATLACSLAPTYEMLMLARVGAGIFGGVLGSLSQTIVGDVIAFERRGRAMAIVMSAFSAATVVGVPMSLFLAAHISWHAPFVAIAAVSGVIAVVAFLTLPTLARHIGQQKTSALKNIVDTMRDRNNQKGFLLSALMMSAGFIVIPYITIYMVSTGGLSQQQVPYVYLSGGIATLISARFVGRLTDRIGKISMFRRTATLAAIPIFGLTLAASLPWWAILVVSTSFFVAMSSRMIPGMAILTSISSPAQRGTFMAINSAVQSCAMGIAAFIGGLIISRDAAGHLQNYWANGLAGATVSLLVAWFVVRITLNGAAVPANTK